MTPSILCQYLQCSNHNRRPDLTNPHAYIHVHVCTTYNVCVCTYVKGPPLSVKAHSYYFEWKRSRQFANPSSKNNQNFKPSHPRCKHVYKSNFGGLAIGCVACKPFCGKNSPRMPSFTAHSHSLRCTFPEIQYPATISLGTLRLFSILRGQLARPLGHKYHAIYVGYIQYLGA